MTTTTMTGWTGPMPVGLPGGEEQRWLGQAPVAYQHRSGLTAILSRDELAPGDLRWHLSVRYGDPGRDGRVPTWEELVRAAHELRPGVVFVVGVPPRSWWVNVHPDVLHLWEIRDKALTETWQAEGQGHQPT